MFGKVSLFFNLRQCRLLPVGGVSGTKNRLVITGVGWLLVMLVNGRVVVIHQWLLVPGIVATLQKSWHNNHL